MRYQTLALFSLALATGSAHAADAPFGTEADITYAKTLWQALEKGHYVGDNAIRVRPYQGMEPHGAILETLDGPIPLTDATSNVLVKKNFGGEGASVDSVGNTPGKFLKSITVMLRRDQYDPEHDNWYYVKYDPEGGVMKNPKGIALAGKVGKGSNQGCIACHKNAPGGDYVFNNDRYKN